MFYSVKKTQITDDLDDLDACDEGSAAQHGDLPVLKLNSGWVSLHLHLEERDRNGGLTFLSSTSLPPTCGPPTKPTAWFIFSYLMNTLSHNLTFTGRLSFLHCFTLSNCSHGHLPSAPWLKHNCLLLHPQGVFLRGPSHFSLTNTILGDLHSHRFPNIPEVPRV